MIELGKYNDLVIIKKTDHGFYLAEDRPLSEKGAPSERERVLLPKKYTKNTEKPGDKIRVFIYKDSDDRLIATTKTPNITLGETALLKVSQTGKIGAFLDSGLEKDFLLPFAEQTKRVKEGEECLTALYIDKSERLCLTMKVYKYLKTDSPYKKDDEVTGRVYEISENFGAFVAVDDRFSALIPKTEPFTDLRVGDIIKARVTEVKEDGKLSLSLRKKAWLQMDEDSEKIMSLIESYDGVLPFTDKASPEVIKRECGMSKNEFKRAVGRLYKERRISITEGRIRKI